MERGKRQAIDHLFGGAWVYVALTACLCAVGVGGYVWLFGGEEAAQETSGGDTGITQAQEQREEGPVVMPETELPRAETIAPAKPAAQETPKTEQKPVQEAPSRRVVSPLLGDTVTAFSADALLYNATTGDWRTHEGIDIAADVGAAVSAAAGGTVKTVGEDDRLGTVVVIAHWDGYETTYAGLGEEVAVSEGESVAAGQTIACVGESTLTESALGAHLHFSVTKDGESVDPDAFLTGAR